MIAKNKLNNRGTLSSKYGNQQVKLHLQDHSCQLQILDYIGATVHRGTLPGSAQASESQWQLSLRVQTITHYFSDKKGNETANSDQPPINDFSFSIF